MTKNILSQDFTPKSLINYAMPTILMMLFMSTYSIIDGIFVSNYVNEDGLAALNIVWPVLLLMFASGMMLAVGGSAVIGKLLGENENLKARQFFSLIYIIGIGLGLFFTLISYSFFHEILLLLGANEVLYPYARDYFYYSIPFIVMMFLQAFSQNFFVTAGKPSYGFIACAIGGIANIILDYVLIVPMNMGIAGAALASGISFTIPGLYGLYYFAFRKKTALYFVCPRWDRSAFLQSTYNGLSEFVNTVAAGIVTVVFNLVLLDLIGKSGVAAVSIIFYIQMLQMAIYLGYSFGVLPVISYKYGEKNYLQLRMIIKTSIWFTGIVSFITILLSFVFANKSVLIFIPETSETFLVAAEGLRIFSFAYFFMGFNIFASAMFTALSNGRLSAILSIARSFVFILLALYFLPKMLSVDGVWLAVPMAEALTILITIHFYKNNRIKYGY